MPFFRPRLFIIFGTYLLLSTQSSTCQSITVAASDTSVIIYEPALSSPVWDQALGGAGKIMSVTTSTDANATFHFLGK